MEDKLDKLITGIMTCLIIILIIVIIWLVVAFHNMWVDHQCYVTNSYGLVPECDKYIKGDDDL